MTTVTVVTMSGVFPCPPCVVGDEWGPMWRVKTDSFPCGLSPSDLVKPWKRSTFRLVVLDESSGNGLSRVWP